MALTVVYVPNSLDSFVARIPPVNAVSTILYKKIIKLNSNVSGDEVYCTNS